eukprot:TRINITY_DN17647_c0_g1_i1.p1 TRINITY_DN17647_c0_g1~~TRINITY_DN17647_c0_g1_i1.p1  ORF type:complete len:295 (-),score=37.68 TRINITY_DN17647_c0_g1_i1:134-1018(-)
MPEDGATSFSVQLKYIATFFWSLLGLLIGGYLGWFFFDKGMPVLVGCGIGWVLMCCLGAACTGLLDYVVTSIRMNVTPPSLQRLRATGFSEWDLYITIHRVQNVYNFGEGNIFTDSKHQFMYITVEIGRQLDQDHFSILANQPMRTCVQQSGVFEETFKGAITPTDNTVRVSLYSQGVVIDTLLGQADISITHDIVGQGFPHKHVKNLLRDASHEADVRNANQLAACCVISFAPGENLNLNKQLQEEHALHAQRRQHLYHPENDPLVKTSGRYSAWATGAGGASMNEDYATMNV